MAAKSMLSVVKSLHTAEQSWCIWLKERGAGDYQQTANCLFAAILGWLGQPSIETLIASVAPLTELISYLKFSLSKYVSYVLSDSAGIFTEYNRFPYQEDTINKWFIHSAERVQPDQRVNIINVDKEGHRRRCYRIQNQADNFPESLRDDDFEIFCHGTNHRSVKYIIENGIKLTQGGKRKDFSDGDGFYVGNNFDEAWKWALKQASSAVLVFRVNRIELRGDQNEKGLNLRDRVGEWQDVITQFRSGKSDPEQFQNDEFIEGPMASGSCGWAYPVQKSGSYQLCVRSDNCAELFDRSLHSVVYFDRYV